MTRRLLPLLALLMLCVPLLAQAGQSGRRVPTPAERAQHSAQMRALLAADRQARPAHVKGPGAPIIVDVDRTDDDTSPPAIACTPALSDCTLRGALLATNANLGTDEIHFALPGAGVQTIVVAGIVNPLPIISEAVLIDGYTQPGSATNALAVGTNAVLQVAISGATLVVDAQDVVIQGLVIQNAQGTVTQDAGIYVSDIGSGRVTGSFIGTDASGTVAAPNCDGVWMDRDGSTAGVFTVGSETNPDRNLISGNTCAGVFVNGDEWNIGNNLIGTNPSGNNALPNDTGVVVKGKCDNPSAVYNNAVVGDYNVISGNTNEGVYVFGFFVGAPGAEKGSCSDITASGLYIELNKIGISADGSSLLTNGGAPIYVDATGVLDLIHVIDNELGPEVLVTGGFERPGPVPAGAVSSPYFQDFDSVTPPALPALWNASNAISSNGVLWQTAAGSTPAPFSLPNVAVIDDENQVSDKQLDSPSIFVTATPAILAFRRYTDFEYPSDGMVLEMSVNGGPSLDVETFPGGRFLLGGYDDVISSGSNPLNGRSAWTADSLVRRTTIYRLPPSVNVGDNVRFRWRVGTDNAVGTSGASIDSVYFGTLDGARSVAAIALTARAKRVDITQNTQFDSGNGVDAGDLGFPFIDLDNDGRTANDTGDGDTGANNRVNFPVITSAVLSGGNLTIDYNYDVPAPEIPGEVEFYRMTSSGAPVEYVATQTASAQAVINGASFVVGDRVAALWRATSTGNTSELGDSVVIAGPQPCVWNPGGAGADVWTNPNKWDFCAAGLGQPPGQLGTPGPLDRVQINSGTVNLDLNVAVTGMEMNGGTVIGDFNIDVGSEFTWSGGTFIASSDAFALTVTNGVGLALLNGGQKNLYGRTLNLQGTVARWTTGLIELGFGAIINIDVGTTFESIPNAAAESIYFNGSLPTPAINNLGDIVKQGANTSGFGTTINFTHSGTLQVQGGTFNLKSNGSSTGSMDVNVGATLAFAENTFDFLAGSSLTGSGNVVFGDSLTTGATYTATGCFGLNGQVSLRNAALSIGCGGVQTFFRLHIEHANAILQGSTNFAIVNELQWFQGGIYGNGAPAATITINAGATASWLDPGSPTPRTLRGRDFLNSNTLTISAFSNPTSLENNARLVNQPGATINLNQSGGTGSFLSSGSGTPEIVNQGAINIQAGSWTVDPVFTNTAIGSVIIDSGAALDFHNSGSDNGSYAVASGADLRLKGAGAIRSLSGAAGSIMGAGALSIGLGGQLTVTAPTYTIATTNLDNTASTLLDLSTGGTVSVGQISMFGGTLTGSSPISISGLLDHRGGVITTTAAGIPTITTTGIGSAVISGTGVKTYRQRALVLNGATTSSWSGDNIQLEAGATITNGPSSQFQMFGNGNASILCPGPCTSSITNNGTLIKPNAVTVTIDPSIVLDQAGIFNIFIGTLNAPSFTQTGGNMLVNFGANLNLGGGTLTINGGVLRGASNNVIGNVTMVGGLLRPDFTSSSVGTFTISGNYTQGAGATLEISTDSGGVADKGGRSKARRAPLGGGGIDFLDVTGTATLNGTLDVVNGGGILNPPAAPTIVSAMVGVSGTFATYTTDYPAYFPNYTATTVFLGPAAPVANPVVNTTADPGNGTCDVAECTLREALDDVNATAVADTITFNIPAAQCVGSGGTCEIHPLTPLPSVLTAVAIDGYSQPGASANTNSPNLGLGSNAVIKVEIDGTVAGGIGLDLGAPAASVSVEGLAITDFSVGVAVTEPSSLPNGVGVGGATNSVVQDGDYAEYLVLIPSGSSNLSIATSASTGDLDLYVRYGAPPDLSTFDCAPFSGSGDETCNFAAPSTGAYYVRVSGYATGPQTFVITASWVGSGTLSAAVNLGGNYVGLHADGSGGSQTTGIEVHGSTLQIGDGSARAMNVISANQAAGIAFLDGALPGNTFTVQGNLIGTAADGSSPRGNLYGIAALSTSVIPGIVIGGTGPTLGNVISRNTAHGIKIDCTAASGACFNGMRVLGNWIGTNPLGAIIGNQANGIYASNLDAGRIDIGDSSAASANSIRNNNLNGIATAAYAGAGRMAFLINRISANGVSAIDLNSDGATANDAGDGDNGPNGLQNFPTLASYALAGGGASATIAVTIDTVDTTSNYPMRVDYYRVLGGQPDTWLGSVNCPTPAPAVCSALITFPAGVVVAANDAIAAIATDNQGRSSEAGTILAPTPNPVVNSVNDPGDGVCNAGECTLREAIDASNLTPANDDITFNIPAVQCGSGTCVILAAQALPPITTPMTIDGYTQPGASANTRPMSLGQGSNAVLKVELDGSGAASPSIDVNAPGATVRIEGLAIHGFNPAQLTVGGALAPIAGRPTVPLGPVMNVYFGGNFLGLKADGSLPPPGGFGSREGINAALGVVQVGDGTARGMNVISGSPGGRGVSLYDAPAGSSFSIRGNLIGTAPDGITARPNFSGGIGVQGAVPGVVIGGNTLDQANVIGGNLGNGLLIDCLDAMSACFGTSLSVTGNFIGVGIGGQALGNSGDGIQVDRLPVGRITLGGPTVSQANVIGNNANNGINAALNIPQLADPRGNVAMLINRTFNNGQLGIDIFNDERTANDAGDIDGVQNFPTFATYALAPDGASASFTFSIDTPSAGGNYPMRVDFYRGDTDEVGSWLGTSTCSSPSITCSANPTFPAGVVLTANDSVIAIATDANGKSSEPSFYATTTSIVSDNPDPSELGTPYTVQVTVQSASPFRPIGVVDVADEHQDGCTATLSALSANSSSGSCQVASVLPLGVRNLSADYGQDQGPFTGSQAITTHTVVQTIPTSTSIGSIAPATTVVGQPYTVTVGVSDGGPVTAGTVTVRQLNDGATCTIDLASATSCQLTSFFAITTAVRAVYSGDSSHGASQSPILSHVVNRASTAVTITADSPDPSIVAEAITITALLEVQAPGAGTPTGTLFVTDGTASCSAQLPNLSCTMVPKALGAATLEARYLGDANFNESVDTEAHTISVDGADLAIVKRNGLRLLPGGAQSTYILLVTNAGPQAVVNARVNDILPGQLSNASWTCSATAGASCPAAGPGTVDTLVSLPPGSSVTFLLTASVQFNPEQVVTNRATVTAPENAPDPITANNESSDTDLIGIYGDGFETESE